MLREEQLLAHNTQRHTDNGEGQSDLQLSRDDAPEAGKPDGVILAEALYLLYIVVEFGRQIIHSIDGLVKEMYHAAQQLPGEGTQLGEHLDHQLGDGGIAVILVRCAGARVILVGITAAGTGVDMPKEFASVQMEDKSS